MDTTLPNEHADFLATLAAFTRDLAPADSIELQMVERLAQIDHRLKRATRLDTATLDHACARFIEWFTEFPEDGPRKADPKRVRDAWTLAGAYSRCAKEHSLISHYEARLSRDYRRTLHDLLALQKSRKQTQTAEPVASSRSHASDGVVTKPAGPRVPTSVTPDLPSTSEPPVGGWTSVRTEVSTSEPKQTPPLPIAKKSGQTNPTAPDASRPSTPSQVDTSIPLQPSAPPQETPSNPAHLR